MLQSFSGVRATTNSVMIRDAIYSVTMHGGIVIAFFGDCVGQPGRRSLQHAIPIVRRTTAPNAIVINGENLRNGSGITPDLYRDLRKMGADAVTLGDHVFRDARITPVLEDPTEPISRPANLAAKAPGKRWIRSDAQVHNLFFCLGALLRLCVLSLN
ncbi:MAG: hypothetical protein EBY29_13365 [Planctomycetes bacterium]|nr:hypothetical protein [Planctomycetota bacterium]